MSSLSLLSIRGCSKMSLGYDEKMQADSGKSIMVDTKHI